MLTAVCTRRRTRKFTVHSATLSRSPPAATPSIRTCVTSSCPSTISGCNWMRRGAGSNRSPYQALQRILGGAIDTPEEDRPISTVSTTRRENLRALLGLQSDFNLAGQDWTLDTGLVWSRNQLDLNWPVDTLTSRMDLAFAGLGGPECDPRAGSPGSGNLGTGACYYYNSFQTSVYDPVTGERWDTADNSPWAPDPRLSVAEAARKYRNPAELLRWTQGAYITDAELEQVVFDLLLSGDAVDTAEWPPGTCPGFPVPGG